MSRPRILVADDDEETRTVLTAVLEKSGYSVETVRDGEEALGTALEEPPDLLLTDVMMPRIDGWTLVKRLRSRGEFALVPVIFLTKLDSEEDRIYGFRLGADDYVPKPFNYEELVARVGRALERRRVMEEEVRRSLSRSDASGEDGSGGRALLEGQLAHFGFSSLLLVFEQQRTTGLLEARHPGGREARVWIRDGRVVRASLEDGEEVRGAEVVYALLGWSSGRFALRPTPVEDRNEVGMSSTHLLLEGARRLDEKEVDRGD